MNCVICDVGILAPGKTTVTLQREETTIIVRDVPADVCDACGEGYLSESVTDRVTECAEQAVAR
jgi:YgiT-type zinc finger domain-containing protein